MNVPLFDKLHEEGLVSTESLEKIKKINPDNLLSVHWEIKTLLYLGVLLLSGGLGILVYKNIDTIGHQAILLFIALVCGGSFFYCFKKKLPFSNGRVEAPNAFFDYLLLLGCLTFIIFIAYLQYQYTAFGTRYGLATFFPMLLLFFTAYYFDHLGILSLAVTSLAAWVGITVTPLHLLQSNDFDSSAIIITGLILGVLLVIAAFATKKLDIKKHFAFVYKNFGAHLLFVSCLAAMFHFEPWYLVWFLLLLAIAWYFYSDGIKEKSFYFILITAIYTYIGTSYVIIELMTMANNFEIAILYLLCLYFIASGIGLILFLIRANKMIKQQ